MAKDYDVTLKDTGCPAGGPSCLRCPLPRCVLDVETARQRTSDKRASEIRALLASGSTATEVADRLGVSRRTVFRAKEPNV